MPESTAPRSSGSEADSMESVDSSTVPMRRRKGRRKPPQRIAAGPLPNHDSVPPELRDTAAALPLLLTVEEAATVLNEHVGTVKRRISLGEMRVIASTGVRGRSIRVPRSELIRYLSEHLR